MDTITAPKFIIYKSSSTILIKINDAELNTLHTTKYTCTHDDLVMSLYIFTCVYYVQSQFTDTVLKTLYDYKIPISL